MKKHSEETKHKPYLEGFLCQIIKVNFALHFEKAFEHVHDSSRAAS